MTGFEQLTSVEGREPPALYGLVLAGGRSARLGRDKAALDFHGTPQAPWAMALLEPFCERVYLSLRADQLSEPVFARLPAVVDDASRGPASGLLAAARLAPAAAWLALAADLPLVDAAIIETLVGARRPDAEATVFRHADGTLEPLCAIYEPTLLARLASEDPGHGASLRRLLEGARATLIDLPDPSRLMSVNTAADVAAARARLAGELR